MSQKRTSRPEKVFRIGFVSASVFAHEVDSDDGKRTLRSVNVQKRYLDGEEVKYTSSFNLAELPQAPLRWNSRNITSKAAKPN